VLTCGISHHTGSSNNLHRSGPGPQVVRTGPGAPSSARPVPVPVVLVGNCAVGGRCACLHSSVLRPAAAAGRYCCRRRRRRRRHPMTGATCFLRTRMFDRGTVGAPTADRRCSMASTAPQSLGRSIGQWAIDAA
jgi:hypothetical protein